VQEITTKTWRKKLQTQMTNRSRIFSSKRSTSNRTWTANHTA